MASDERQARIYELAFSLIRGNNVTMGEKLLSLLDDESEFFTLSSSQLCKRLNVRASVADDKYRRELVAYAERELDFLENNKIKALYFKDGDYPVRLANCNDAPVMLFKLGDVDLDAKKIVAVVGTRKSTPYGLDATKRIIGDLAGEYGNDLVIVSGLAYGIDIAAHRAALSNGIPTVAVTAQPLNTIYPADHRKEAVEMIRNAGGLVTEYASCQTTHRGNFLARNRIIAGLADATIIVESDLKGGAMVTAMVASAYNRDVFAVPGRISDRYSRGCNHLITTNRAVLIDSGDTLIDIMGWERKVDEGAQSVMTFELTEQQREVLLFIREHGDYTVNEIVQAMGITYSELTNVLFELELADMVVSVLGNRYALTTLANDV